MNAQRCYGSKFTPGPWIDAGHYMVTTAAVDQTICQVYGTFDEGFVEGRANLSLITAAPGLFEELGKVPCAECQHPLWLHIARYGCEHELGDREGNEGEPMQAMGPCSCRGDEFSQKAIAELRKAGGKQ